MIAADHLWRLSVSALWSPHVRPGAYVSWRATARHLEDVTMSQLCSLGVKAALRDLAMNDMVSHRQESSIGVSSSSQATVNHTGGASSMPWATPLSLDIVRNTLAHRSGLDCRRNVALFVCSSDFAAAPTIQPDSTPIDNSSSHHTDVMPEDSSGNDRQWEASGNLVRVMEKINVIDHARDPEDALRQLLLVFPFLPIDAGEGADRVIRALAERYLASHPDEYADLRRSPDPIPSSVGTDSTDPSQSSGTHSEAAVSAAARHQSCHDDAESAIYILVYAVIMLNTDLHHPSIKHKMQPDEFVRSTRSTVLGTTFAPSDLLRIYASVARAPLAIGTRQLTVRRTEEGAATSRARSRGARAPATGAPLWGVGSDSNGVTTTAQGFAKLNWWPFAIGGVGAAIALVCTLLPPVLRL
jgi:hypothetical protein